MAANKMPSFLKRQKETQRAAKASRKREARQARNEAKAAGGGENSGAPIEALDPSQQVTRDEPKA